jgi:hypothetical protein
MGAIRGSGRLETLEQLKVHEDRSVSEDETPVVFERHVARTAARAVRWMSVSSSISTTSSSRKVVDSCLRRPMRFFVQCNAVSQLGRPMREMLAKKG